ncbi:MAG: type II toxin-antitoxin system RelE family toxin [Microcystaceae cyanobacterium]
MKVKFSKNTVKFLNKLDKNNREKIREKINYLFQSLENEGIIPFTALDIKKLKGEWEGFFRIRLGNIRIIFTLNQNLEELLIYEIDFRGNFYKKK